MDNHGGVLIDLPLAGPISVRSSQHLAAAPPDPECHCFSTVMRAVAAAMLCLNTGKREEGEGRGEPVMGRNGHALHHFLFYCCSPRHVRDYGNGRCVLS